ncbi:MAG: hypothetical protein H0W36_11155 [Gemmatimonadetes bacterium]|nr:hypothetical protein [Gemmatimonadota bacterium]
MSVELPEAIRADILLCLIQRGDRFVREPFVIRRGISEDGRQLAHPPKGLQYMRSRHQFAFRQIVNQPVKPGAATFLSVSPPTPFQSL